MRNNDLPFTRILAPAAAQLRLPSSGMLRCVVWYLVTDVSGQPIHPDTSVTSYNLHPKREKVSIFLSLFIPFSVSSFHLHIFFLAASLFSSLFSFSHCVYFFYFSFFLLSVLFPYILLFCSIPIGRRRDINIKSATIPLFTAALCVVCNHPVI